MKSLIGVERFLEGAEYGLRRRPESPTAAAHWSIAGAAARNARSALSPCHTMPGRNSGADGVSLIARNATV